MVHTIISSNRVYRIDLPAGYVLKETGGSEIIYSENGIGAVNITCYAIPSNYVFDIEKELLDFSASIDSCITPNVSKVENNGYAVSEFISQSKFWKIWAFFKNHQAVFASYNCFEMDKGHEINKVDRMMQSLKIIKKQEA